MPRKNTWLSICGRSYHFSTNLSKVVFSAWCLDHCRFFFQKTASWQNAILFHRWRTAYMARRWFSHLRRRQMTQDYSWASAEDAKQNQERKGEKKGRTEKMLTKETFEALKFTTKSTVNTVCYYLLDNGFNFVLTRRFSSDDFERFFGSVRQMMGGVRCFFHPANYCFSKSHRTHQVIKNCCCDLRKWVSSNINSKTYSDATNFTWVLCGGLRWGLCPSHSGWMGFLSGMCSPTGARKEYVPTFHICKINRYEMGPVYTNWLINFELTFFRSWWAQIPNKFFFPSTDMDDL